MKTDDTTTDSQIDQGGHGGQGGHAGMTQRAVVMMAANVVAMILSFALPLLLVRVMSQSDYGTYKQAFQIMQSAIVLLNLQVAVSVFYFSAREPGKKLAVVLNVALFYTIVGTIVFLFFLAWPEWVTLIFHSNELVPHIPLLGFTILCWLVSTNLEAAPIAAGDIRIASILIVASQLTKTLLMISAGYFFGTLHAILVAAVIQGLIQLAFMAFYIQWRYGSLIQGFEWPLFKLQIGASLPFGVGGIVSTVQADMHSYFVSYFFNPAIFAIYAVGCFQLPLLGMLSQSFANAVNPDLASRKEQNDYPGIISLWMDMIRKLALFYIPAFVLLFIMRREFIIALFTTDYAESTAIFSVNLLSLLIGMANQLHVMRLFDELKYFRLKISLALIPLTWGSLYFGLRVGGLIGVTTAVVAIQAIDFAITVLVINRELKMSWRDLQGLVPVVKTGGAAAISGLVAALTRLLFIHSHPLLSFAVCASVFGITYIIAVFSMGALSKQEKADLQRLVSKYSRSGWARLKMTSATEG